MEKIVHTEGVEVLREGGGLRVQLSGVWSIYKRRPAFAQVVPEDELEQVDTVGVDCSAVDEWDSQLLVFLLHGRNACKLAGIRFVPENLPAGMDKLLEQVSEDFSGRKEETPRKRRSLPATVGDWSTGFFFRTREVLNFTGEIVVSFLRLLTHPHRFRWRDSLEAMQQTGAMALPIVGLISFLVGVIMAFQAAIQLRQFGADIFVANLVGLAVVREMGPMMAAVVLAGRTGAAFAAQIGTMKVNEEIDALQTLGTSPIDFLVMPRMLALFLMMPLLALYSDFLGIIGGMFVASTVMDITPASYFAQTREAIVLADIYSGLIKAVAFGLLIAFAGCLRGLQCGRSSAGVGAAATSAVVTSILLVIVADALFAVIFNRLGI
jgi:phospholipid/cholesterol/gamma-HCH transport system permease protein